MEEDKPPSSLSDLVSNHESNFPQKNIGFVSTRFAGTDGVSLEASKWADVFEKSGHQPFWFAGELDRDPDKSYLVPEAHFTYKENKSINGILFGTKNPRPRKITDQVYKLKENIKNKLYDFLDKFNIDLLIPQNAMTIPVNVPLGLALAEIIQETNIPTIAHHHDFYWERERFTLNCAKDYLSAAFPLRSNSNVMHVTINSNAQVSLASNLGISSTVIPNVLDYSSPPHINTERASRFRESLDIKPDDYMVLLPLRVVPRKALEVAVEIIAQLGDEKYNLVVSHEAGDEGFKYRDKVKNFAARSNVKIHFVEAKLRNPWQDYGEDSDKSSYTLWDIYPNADLVIIPSMYEGFGNAFLEAVYFKKPVVINRYQNFVTDIEPHGFNLITMDGFADTAVAEKVYNIMESYQEREEMVNKNYSKAKKLFGYSVLRDSLNTILKHFYGTDFSVLTTPDVPSITRKTPDYVNSDVRKIA